MDVLRICRCPEHATPQASSVSATCLLSIPFAPKRIWINQGITQVARSVVSAAFSLVCFRMKLPTEGPEKDPARTKGKLFFNPKRDTGSEMKAKQV